MAALKPPKPREHLPPILLPSLLFLASTTISGYFLSQASVTAFSYPKSPLLLHHLLLPEVLFIIALCSPIPQHLKPHIFLPPILVAHYTLLGASSAISPFWACGVGMYSAFLLFNSLLLILFQRLPPDRPSSLLDAINLTIDFRGIGEKWQTRVPVETPGNWWARRVIRLIKVYVYMDFLAWWYRVYDRAYHVPLQLGTEAQLPSRYIFPGLQNPEFPSSPADDSLPLGWTYPENPLEKMAMVAGLWFLRGMLHMSTIFVGFSAVHCVLSILIVGFGELFGYRKGWCARSAWPNVFGHWLSGDLGFGVRGFWSRAWHSMFRRIFTGPSIWLYPKDSPSSMGKTVTWLIMPFLVSGILHLFSVWTVVPHHGWGTVRFFMLQPLGMLLEMPLLKAAKNRSGTKYGWVWRAAVYVWALAWLLPTSKGFFEDYRWNGLWWTEPVPLSLWAKFVYGKSWTEAWRWGGPWLRWARDAAEGGVMGSWGVVLVN